MLLAIDEHISELKKQFQSLMAAAPPEFYEWARDYFNTQAIAFGHDLAAVTVKATPKVEPPAPVKTATATKFTAPKVQFTGTVPKSVANYAANKGWMPVLSAPIVKKKAANPISLHIPKGAKVKFKKFNSSTDLLEGEVTGFTATNVKIQGLFGGYKVSYSKVKEVYVP